MKQSCIFLLLVWGASGFGYHILFQGSQFDTLWWLAPLLGLGAALVVANFLGIIQAIQQKAVSTKPFSEWKDGTLVSLSGKLQALGTPVSAPFSGLPSTIVSYDLKQHSGSGSDASSTSTYMGFMMTPCAIQSDRGPVKIVGFPLLAQIQPEIIENEGVHARAATFLATTKFMAQSSNPIQALKSINEVLSDNDGIVSAHFCKPGSWFHSEPEDEEELSEETQDQEATPPSEQSIEKTLRNRELSFEETAIKNGEVVTVFGTYNKQRNWIDIGGGLSNISHQLHRGEASSVTSKGITRSVITTLFWATVVLGANWFVLSKIGALPPGIPPWPWEQGTD